MSRKRPHSRPQMKSSRSGERKTENEKQSGRSNIWVVVAAVAGPAVAIVALLFTPVSNMLSAWWESLPPQMVAKYDGKSPVTTKCVEDNEEWKTFRYSQPGAVMDPSTLMRVNGSESCQAAWVYVANSLDGTRVEKTIERMEENWLAGARYSTPDDLTIDPLVNVDGKETIGPNGQSYTDQVYAPGCVWVSLKLTDPPTGDVIWEIPRQEVCKP